MVAMLVVTELHVPPLVASVSDKVVEGHIAAMPLIVPALGNGLTVIVLIAIEPETV